APHSAALYPTSLHDALPISPARQCRIQHRRRARPEPRTTTGKVIRALLAPLTTKNCWTLAQQAGHQAPYRIQHLLGRSTMDEPRSEEHTSELQSRFDLVCRL